MNSNSEKEEHMIDVGNIVFINDDINDDINENNSHYVLEITYTISTNSSVAFLEEIILGSKSQENVNNLAICDVSKEEVIAEYSEHHSYS